MSPVNLSLQQLHKQMVDKQIKASELVAHYLRQIKQLDGTINAFITVDEERALAIAAQYDELLQAGEPIKPLIGVPVGLKDNIVTENLLTTAASRMLSNHMPVYNATVVERLTAAQAVVLGKLNMDELGLGVDGSQAQNGAVRNPWNTAYVAGGSSGGSAAAVAAGEVPFALGSDTGGDVRQPAAYCGVVGLKPTYGLVSRFGLIAASSSLDHVGTLTRTVEDAAYVLQAIAGHDPLDSTSAQVDIPNYSAVLSGDSQALQGLKIGVPQQFFADEVAAEVKDAVQKGLQQLEQLGASCQEISLPHFEYGVATYAIISAAEASSNLSRLDGVRFGVRAEQADDLIELYTRSRSEGLGERVKQTIIEGTYALSSGQAEAYFQQAQKVRTLIKQDLVQALDSFDIIVGPTTPTTAFEIGATAESRYAHHMLTIPASLSGHPALSLPCGFAHGLPIGMQLIGRPYDEATLLKVGYAFEQHTAHHKQQPELS